MREIKPKQLNRKSFEITHRESECNQFNYYTTFEVNSKNTVSIFMRCKNCEREKEERYLLGYTERLSDGKRWERREIPQCKCENKNVSEDNKFFDEGRSLIIKSFCNNCSTVFKDSYYLVGTY